MASRRCRAKASAPRVSAARHRRTPTSTGAPAAAALACHTAQRRSHRRVANRRCASTPRSATQLQCLRAAAPRPRCRRVQRARHLRAAAERAAALAPAPHTFDSVRSARRVAVVRRCARLSCSLVELHAALSRQQRSAGRTSLTKRWLSAILAALLLEAPRMMLVLEDHCRRPLRMRTRRRAAAACSASAALLQRENDRWGSSCMDNCASWTRAAWVRRPGDSSAGPEASFGGVLGCISTTRRLWSPCRTTLHARHRGPRSKVTGDKRATFSPKSWKPKIDNCTRTQNYSLTYKTRYL